MTAQRIVVFDLGQVLVEPIGLNEALAGILSVTPTQIAEVYDTHRRLYDTGLPDRDYWIRTLAELGLQPARGGLPDLSVLLPQLVETDVAGWSTPRPEAVQLLEDLRGQAQPVVVLSNAPTALAKAAEQFPWRDLAQHWFFSAPLGMAKPDPAIYAHVEQTLEVAAEQLWFVDDKAENIAAAADRGWHTRRWQSVTDARHWLQATGLLAA